MDGDCTALPRGYNQFSIRFKIWRFSHAGQALPLHVRQMRNAYSLYTNRYNDSLGSDGMDECIPSTNGRSFHKGRNVHTPRCIFNHRKTPRNSQGAQEAQRAPLINHAKTPRNSQGAQGAQPFCFLHSFHFSFLILRSPRSPRFKKRLQVGLLIHFHEVLV
jgi:hypothetical protein